MASPVSSNTPVFWDLQDPRFSLPLSPGRRVYCNKTNIVYELGQQIGSGAAAVVFRCRRVLPSTNNGASQTIDSETEYAAKILNLRGLRLRNDFEREREKLRREVTILGKLHHPCIVNLLHVIETKDELFCIMELVKGGELFYKLIEKGAFTEDETRYILIQILHALHYMHGKNIIHRDLKPENILIAGEVIPTFLHVKVADFGLAKLVCTGLSEAKTFVGTPQYWAPEVIDSATNNSTYGVEADLWSLGCVLYVMLGGAYPFDSRLGPIDVLIKQAQFHFRYPRFQRVSDSAKDLIRGLLTVDPTRRITLPEVFQHRWVQEFRLPVGVPSLPPLLPLYSADVENIKLSTLSILNDIHLPGTVSSKTINSGSIPPTISSSVPKSISPEMNIKNPNDTSWLITQPLLKRDPQQPTTHSPEIFQLCMENHTMGQSPLNSTRVFFPSTPIEDTVYSVKPNDKLSTQAIIPVYSPYKPTGYCPVMSSSSCSSSSTHDNMAHQSLYWANDQQIPSHMLVPDFYPHLKKQNTKISAGASDHIQNYGQENSQLSRITKQATEYTQFCDSLTQPLQKDLNNKISDTSLSNSESTGVVLYTPTTESVSMGQADTHHLHHHHIGSTVTGMNTAAPVPSSRLPYVPLAGRQQRDDFVKTAEMIFNFDELLCLQISVMRKFHWAYIALRHSPQASKGLKDCIAEGQQIQLCSAQVVRQFETTCASVLALFPDLSLAVSERQIDLALKLLEDIRGWVMNLKAIIEFHQQRISLFMRQIGDLVDAIRLVKTGTDAELVSAALRVSAGDNVLTNLTKNHLHDSSFDLQNSFIVHCMNNTSALGHITEWNLKDTDYPKLQTGISSGSDTDYDQSNRIIEPPFRAESLASSVVPSPQQSETGGHSSLDPSLLESDHPIIHDIKKSELLDPTHSVNILPTSQINSIQDFPMISGQFTINDSFSDSEKDVIKQHDNSPSFRSFSDSDKVESSSSSSFSSLPIQSKHLNFPNQLFDKSTSHYSDPITSSSFQYDTPEYSKTNLQDKTLSQSLPIIPAKLSNYDASPEEFQQWYNNVKETVFRQLETLVESTIKGLTVYDMSHPNRYQHTALLDNTVRDSMTTQDSSSLPSDYFLNSVPVKPLSGFNSDHLWTQNNTIDSKRPLLCNDNKYSQRVDIHDNASHIAHGLLDLLFVSPTSWIKDYSNYDVNSRLNTQTPINLPCSTRIPSPVACSDNNNDVSRTPTETTTENSLTDHGITTNAGIKQVHFSKKKPLCSPNNKIKNSYQSTHHPIPSGTFNKEHFYKEKPSRRHSISNKNQTSDQSNKRSADSKFHRHYQRQQFYNHALRTSEILIRALDEVRRVNQIMRQSTLFWANLNSVLDRLCQMKTHTERLLEYSTASQKFMDRFFERLGDYHQFWRSLRDQCRNYAIQAELKLAVMDEFAISLESTADRVDTANALNLGETAALMRVCK